MAILKAINEDHQKSKLCSSPAAEKLALSVLPCGGVRIPHAFLFSFRLDLNNEVFSLFSADGPPVVCHYDISDTDSDQESMSVETVRPTVIKHELKRHRGQDLAAHSGCIRAVSSNSGQLQTR